MPRGRRPDIKRREQVVALRQQGLTMPQIAARLGISRQAVHQLLEASGEKIDFRVRVCCCRCKREITRGPVQMCNNGPALCLACLDWTLEPTFGQRQKALRLAAGLTLRELQKRTGIDRRILSNYESDIQAPKWQAVVRLARVLGARLVLLPGEGPAEK